MPSARRLFDFRDGEEADAWTAVSDPVMGGCSQARMSRDGDGVGVFAGTVSLENNGGFASIHRPLPSGSLAGAKALLLRCMGDGRRYSLRLRQDAEFDGISYRLDFTPEAGHWQEIELPLDQFRPVFRGRELTTAGPLRPEKIIRLGFLLARQPGDFHLRIQWLERRPEP